MFVIKRNKIMYIIISGMNNITINLAKKFISDGNEITFIGLDKNKAKEIEKDIGFVTVLGSSYNKSTLIEAGIERANFFVASNMEDEINFLSIKLAKHLNNEIISICLVNKISNKKNFSGEDFDFALEYDEIISDTLNSFIANKVSIFAISPVNPAIFAEDVLEIFSTIFL